MSTQMKAELSQEELSLQFEYMKQVRELLAQRYDHPPLAHVHSYGCQANVAEGERIQGMLAQMGYGFTDSPDDADFILYNTCAIRKGAEDRVFGNVGALQHNKRRRPDMIIALCGCMTQQEQVAARMKRSYPHVDLVFGTHATHRFPQMVHEVLSSQKRVFHIEETENIIAEGLPIRRDGDFKAWIPIMYGCDNFCTYCIVPYVKGRERSRRPGPILDEVRELAAKGYREFTLLGQNVNSYGKGLDEPVSFASLLRKINEIEGDFRVRFMTSHPKDCTHELIDTIAECDKLCKHIHLPVQCGSDRILKQMNRHYTLQQYRELIDYARKKIPGVSFTSDIIVGFPGETYEDFCETLALIREVEYDSLYTFIYSPREGTRAAQMEDPVPGEEKSRWFQELLETQEQIGIRHNEARVGKVLRVLAEGEAKNKAGWLTGHADNGSIVNFPADQDLIGSFVPVRITRALNWAVEGEPVF